MRLDKQDIGIITSTSLLFVCFALIIKFSGISVNSAIVIQNQIIKMMIATSQPGGFITPLIYLIIAEVLLAGGLAILGFFGTIRVNYTVGLLAGTIGSAANIILIGPSIAVLFLSLGLILAAVTILQLSNMYFKELKRWKFFRTGSNSISKALILMNFLLFVGVYLTVHVNAAAYQENFREELIDLTYESMIAQVPEDVPIDTIVLRQQIIQSIDSSSIFKLYAQWLPLITALSVWVVLEFLRNILLSMVGGTITSILLRIKEQN